MNSLNVLLIGLGNMGKIHKRVIEDNDDTTLFGIVDSSFKKKHEVIDGVEYYDDIQSINLDNGLIDAVVISSTTSSHYKIAKKFLEKRIPVLLEKPISTDKNEIKKLLSLVQDKDAIFRCGLIEIYNPIFSHIKKLNLNDIISIHIYRHSQPSSPLRELDNVLFDLTLHDISVLGFLFNNSNLQLNGQNFNLADKSAESVDLLYSLDGMNIFISTSRESQIKIRKWDILTKNKLYKVDLVQKSIDVYESGSINYTSSNLLDSKVNHSTLSFSNHNETAKIQLNEFVNNIKSNLLDKNHLELIKYSHNKIVELDNL